jgi:hypothetical protein
MRPILNGVVFGLSRPTPWRDPGQPSPDRGSAPLKLAEYAQHAEQSSTVGGGVERLLM